jgi:hypothetical protein
MRTSAAIIAPTFSKDSRDELPHQCPPLMARLLLNLSQRGFWVLVLPLLQSPVRRSCCFHEQLFLRIHGRRRHVHHSVNQNDLFYHTSAKTATS